MAALVIGAICAAAVAGAFTLVEGAVVVSGTLAVEGRPKKIQHPSGGVVAQIAVAEGSNVAAGDLLIRLDETLLQVSLDILRNGFIAERARLARLQALRDHAATPQFPADLASDARLRPVLDGEVRLAKLQRDSQQEQRRGLEQQIEQSRQEIRGIQEQRKSFTQQRDLVGTDLEDLEPLYRRGHVQRPRISGLQRELMRNEGAIGDAEARIRQAQAKITETEFQIARIEHDFVADTIRQLRESETEIGELREKMVAAEDQLRRVDIRAPLAGRVHELAVHTIGGVASPGDVLMLIVPDADRLVVDLRIRPSDIAQLSVGQEARVRLSALDRRQSDEIEGVLTRIGADLTYDLQGRFSFYSATLVIPEGQLARLRHHRLIPGMPAEVFIRTGERTLASYILKPLGDQISRAFRER